MFVLRALAVFAPLLSVASAQSWPFGPFTTNGRFIQNSLGQTVTLVGANWPGAADTMAPEGLQYSSIANIVTKIKSMGMNAIRLTYAIEMIDDYFANGQVDIPVKTSFINALGVTNGTAVFNQIIAHNPQFNAQTTRLQLFDAVAAECFKQQVYVHLDNHVSKAIWCCSDTDGNAWFGDTFFNVANWKRGLAFMAARGATWGNMMTMSLRNELRSPDNNAAILPTYNWETWYANMMPAAAGINAANSGVLIFLSGLNFDTTLAPITTGTNLGSGTIFRKTDFSFGNKLVLEIHNYETGTTNCASLEAELQTDGFNGMNASNPAVKNVFPVVMTEWGHAQDAADYATIYQSCLASFFEGLQASWMVWVLAGSYYIRQGIQDYDETWGLLNHQWTAFRDTTNVNNNIIPMVKGTLA